MAAGDRSEYDPILPQRSAEESEDLEQARELFAAASRPYLRSPWSWLAWALLLPAAALVTPAVLAATGGLGVLALWSGAILIGGGVEMGTILRHGRRSGTTPLAGWALRVQGNLSLIAVGLSLVLLHQGLAWALPGVWLLLLGHSFFLLGGLAFRPLRACGLLYQIGGLIALWPGGQPLVVFAFFTAAGNLWVAWSLWRRAAG